MKCPSVACLWPATAPSHHITAAATLLPSSLFTGGSDGSIIRWSLSSDGQILPLSVLCGHSAPISDLASSNPNFLLSACADAVLCAWSSATGRCRRRRRLPPWTGRPSILSPLPASPRHVCVVADSAIVIVDSWSLNVVQTVLRGGSAIGKVMALAAVPSAVDDAHDLVLVDGSGKARVLMVAEESEKNGEGGGSLPRGSSSDLLSLASVLGENLSEGLLAVAISVDGTIMAFVFETCCFFKLVSTGMVVSEISLKGSSLCSGEGASLNAHLVGGMFLQGDGGGIFALWSNNGAAIVYTVLSLDDVLKVEPLCEVPGLMHSLDGKSSVQFSQLDCLFVRVESVCLRVGNSDVWKPHVTAWLVPLLDSSINSSHGSVPLSKLLGEGCFPGYPTGEKEGSENSSQRSGVAGSGAMDTGNGKIEKDGNVMNERIVSSSMVLSEDYYAPYAVVYGFYSGEIEVVRFTNIFPELNSSAGSHQDHVNPFISEQFFEGHTGAVLCLAAHCLAANSGKRHFRRLLVSGSMDCTTRIWDFDSGSLLSVMHHHIAPVKQIILPPPWTDRPWRDCFLSVGEDCCVALVSLETLRVERMFPGHPSYPSTVAWDSSRGYVACLCQNILSLADSSTILYLWDVKSGARERIIRGSASHSMFEHFCRGINVNSITGSILGGTTSASSLLLSVINDLGSSQSHKRRPEKGMTALPTAGMSQSSKGKQPFLSAPHDISSNLGGNSSTSKVSSQKVHRNKTHPIKCFCPFPGIASLEFDLSSLMTIHFVQSSDKQVASHSYGHESKELTFQHGSSDDNSDVKGLGNPSTKESLEECLLRFSLCFLHLWDVDKELDKLLMEEMDVHKPEGFYVSSGLLGDRGSLTLMFPGLYDTLELWKSSAEFCAMRSLAIVSLAQRMISLSHSSTAASSALAAFYTRNFAEKVPDIKPPLLQLLVSFWQDPSEHVRMAARSLFHCAAPRAIPHPLCGQRTLHLQTPSSSGKLNEENASVSTGSTCLTGSADSGSCTETVNNAELEKTRMIEWLESFEVQEWASCIGGTSQDAMASHIIVAAALVVWYPSIVKHDLAILVVNPLLKLVMSMNDKYSLTAAELLAEGMESTWKACLGPEIPRLVGDIFFQIECLTGTQANNPMGNPSVAVTMKEALVEILLPSLAMADIPGFLNLIEGQIWATSSDSPVHVASLKTLIRVVRGSPKPLALYLDKAVSYVLQTMDPGNLVMRKACLNTSLVALREITRVFPMVAMNELSTRLAVGDAIGDIRSVTIRVYDIESVTKIKILDASGPLGLPSLLEGGSNPRVAAAISALSFSSDGEGLVAFSENGLMIRWWSLGTAWWEKLSRNLVPVQCTKLIFVPPWEGFSPNSSRTSIMASIVGRDKQMDSQEKTRELDDVDNLKLLLHNLDLSYRLQWVSGRNVLLTQHGQELGTFQL